MGIGAYASILFSMTPRAKAIALGAVRNEVMPFRIPYRGREQYHYVGDVGRHFTECTLRPFTGFGTLNIPGETCEVRDFISTLNSMAKEAGMEDFADVGIVDEAPRSMFACDLDPSAMGAAFPGIPVMSLRDGVRLALEELRDLAERGILTEL